MEHLIEENQFQCGLHHPANTVPACSECNQSRDKAVDGSRLTWEQHLKNIGNKKGYNRATIEKRRVAILTYFEGLDYPKLTTEESTYLQTTSRELYQDILKRCTLGTRGFLSLKGKEPVQLKLRTLSKISSATGRNHKKMKIE